MKTSKITVLISFILVVLWSLKFVSSNLRIEGYTGLILESLFPDHDTLFAEKYSDSGFLTIKKGMRKEEVLTILGEPLTQWVPKENYISLQYSKSERSTHYRLRQIYLRDGVVKEIIGYYYVD